MAYVAAISPLLILLLGPLAQQSVTLKLRPANTTDAEPTLPTVTNYTSQTFVDSFDTPYSAGSQYSVDPKMKMQVLQGLLEPTADLNDVQTSCTTSNCTFPSYSTVGVCHSTVDYTSHIVSSCQRIRRVDDSDGPLDCTYKFDTLPSDNSGKPFTSSYANNQQNISFGQARYKDVMVNTPDYGENNPLLSIGFDFDYLDEGNIVTFFVIHHNHTGNETDDLKVNVRALKGIFRFCVYNLDTTVRDGRTSTSINAIYKDIPWRQINETMTDPHSNQSLYSAAFLEVSDTKERFVVDRLSKWSMNQYLSRLVLKGDWAGNSTYDHAEYATTDVARALGRAMFRQLPDGTSVFQGLEGVERMLNNTATRLTNA